MPGLEQEKRVLKIKMYPAANGDAFLVSAAGTNVLFDGGYADTFDKHIVDDLQDIASKGECLDLVVASHIDADHISGLIRFLTVNGPSVATKIVPIEQIWHNSLRSLTTQNDQEIRTADREILDAIRRRGHVPQKGVSGSGATAISARQGSSLASLIQAGGYKWNFSDGTTRISVNLADTIPLRGGDIRVVGPPRERLNGLLKWWRSQLRQMGYKGPLGAGDAIDDAFDLECERNGQATTQGPVKLSAGGYKPLDAVYEPDTSVTNGSSIAAITELGGVRILMLADAWAEDVVQALEHLQSQGVSMRFDAIKISHHGSLRNTSPLLLQLVDAPKYFVSSNGMAHGHPDAEVLAAIVDRPSPFPRALYFNYATSASSYIKNHRSTSGTPFIVHINATRWIEIETGTDD